MEVSIFSRPVNGKIPVKVSCTTDSTGRNESLEILVWVSDNDSKSLIAKETKAAAIRLIKEALEKLETKE
ncbi:hypothetical protein [Rheinheimera pleomorphica]|uniref:hypothetical protein n=1 Tax=Rheinheimera pleomorphica TaxID=2703963 RepID=UPI0014244000|nr:hypothetical protein [Rheinheimera pleomorphica]